MSYYQGTQLYYHGSNPSYATVVTDGNVMITFGLGAGTIIKLADWLLLSRGEKVHEAFTALNPADSVPITIVKQTEREKWEASAETDERGIKHYSCGCTSDGLLCDTHLYE